MQNGAVLHYNQLLDNSSTDSMLKIHKGLLDKSPRANRGSTTQNITTAVAAATPWRIK